jgi:Ca2+-binding RTX toxin-like protein
MTNYDEDEVLLGDLSNEPTKPTTIILSTGSNRIKGNTTNTKLDPDFFTFEVPEGFIVAEILLTDYKWGDGLQNKPFYGKSYFALTQGSSFTSIMNDSGFEVSKLIDNRTTDSELGLDLLEPGVGQPALLTSPSGAGQLDSGVYSVWYQETMADTTYEFDIQLVATNVIPTLTITPIQGTEADGTQFTITVATDFPVIGTQSVDLALSGDAVPADFAVAIPNQITILDGQTSGSVSVTVNDDAVDESETETATFTISNASAGITLANPISQNVNIADDDTTPSFSGPTTFTVSETKVEVGSIVIEDADGDALTLSIIGGADQAAFNLAGNILNFNAAPDFEAPGSVDGDNEYLVQLSVTDGTNTTTQEIIVNVVELDPPTAPIFGTTGDDTLELTGTKQLVFAGAGNDLVDANASDGDNRIYGGSGDDTFILGSGDELLGQAGSDRFFAQTGGNNLLTGGAGADQFWIASAEILESANTVTDFTLGEDVIGIAGLGASFGTLTLTQQEENALIAFNGNDLAVLNGLQTTGLSADNFVFV